MPAVMIRQLEALARIMAETTSDGQPRVLLEQAAMIQRASERSVPEAADRADIQRRYEAIFTMESRLTARERNCRKFSGRVGNDGARWWNSAGTPSWRSGETTQENRRRT